MKGKANRNFDWQQVEQLIDDIFERQYYTNHGPELRDLETELEKQYPGDEVLGMANFDIAFLISLISIGTKNDIILPSLIQKSIYQSLTFLNRKLFVVPVDQKNGIIDLETNLSLNLKNDVPNVLVVNNTLGNTPDWQLLLSYAIRHNAVVILLSKNGFGRPSNFDWPNNVLLLEIFDFGEESKINAQVGAAVRSNDKFIAEKLRNIRSSYGAREKLSIPFTGNGRMSEIQAGLVSCALKVHLTQKNELFRTFEIAFEVLSSIDNLNIFKNTNETTISFNDKIILNTTNNFCYDLEFLNQNLQFLNDKIKTPSDFELIVLNNNHEAQKFIDNSLVIPLHSGISMDQLIKIKIALENQLL